MLDLDKLPNDIQELKKLLVETSKSYQAEISRLESLVLFFKRRVFGKSSETVSSEQLGLFNEVEVEVKAPPNFEEETQEEKKSNAGRRGLPKNLERQTITIDLPDSEKKCSCCGGELIKMGEEKSEVLELVPAEFKVVETIRNKYVCSNKSCDQGVKTPPPPAVPIPRSIASPSLLAFLIVSKFVDHLPLYRLSNILERFGVNVSRGSMAMWMIRVSDLLLPLFNLLHEILIESKYIHMDETRVQVLDEPGKTAESKSYMWVYGREGPPGDSIVLFEYDSTRSSKVPNKILEDFEGYLQVDGYVGYDSISLNPNIKRMGCMYHVRRKFHDAWIEAKKVNGKASEGLAFIKMLSKIEEKIANKLPEEKFKIRDKESRPILDDMKKWIDVNVMKVPKESTLGKAFSYAKNEWSFVIKYLEDGRLSISNNFIENKIRPFAVGRKNWLFSQSVEGAKASAVLYSIIQTAESNGFEPWEYLRHVLKEIPKAKTLQDLEKLLPLKGKFKK